MQSKVRKKYKKNKYTQTLHNKKFRKSNVNKRVKRETRVYPDELFYVCVKDL